jgi:hypothetical protein
MEFTSNSCSSQCPGASIYRLGCRMGVRQNIPRHRQDGGHGPSGRTTVQPDFLKILLRNLSCIRTSSGQVGLIVRTVARPLQVISITGFARPDHGGGASEQLNFNRQFPYHMCVHPNHEGQMSGWLKSNQQFPYTMHQLPDQDCQTSGRSILKYDSYLMETRVRTGYHIVRTVD